MITINFTTDDLIDYVNECLEGTNGNHNKFTSLAYIGGTLVCVEKKTGMGILMNLSGTLTYDHAEGSILLLQPAKLLEIVRRCYIKTKGETTYFKNELLKYTLANTNAV